MAILERHKVLKNSTGSATDTPPVNAIGISAIIANAGTNATYWFIIAGQVLAEKVSPTQDFCRFLFVAGTKAAHGFKRILPGDTIQVSNSVITAQVGSPAEGGLTDITVEYVIADPTKSDTSTIFLPDIPFLVDSGQSEISNVISQTSPATTAQTIDLKPNQGVEISIQAAWFYAGSSIAGDVRLWDGTTAVVIKTVTGTTGDITPGLTYGLASTGLGTQPMWRMNLPATASATSTGYISFRARLYT